jgi:hypothetical protein
MWNFRGRVVVLLLCAATAWSSPLPNPSEEGTLDLPAAVENQTRRLDVSRFMPRPQAYPLPPDRVESEQDNAVVALPAAGWAAGVALLWIIPVSRRFLGRRRTSQSAVGFPPLHHR